ncbi:MAG: TonB-dependent receptor plug domain-containing protein, partial [Bacteroidota bacterium]|nr:TonB-dependent receptor plug domain-containing protein [Bacteroidota bacterium]
MHHHPTVFLIDDDTDDQEIFGLAVEKTNTNASCVFANDGILALEKIRHEDDFKPDYIFIDMNMPRMNGQQCLAEIKKIERLKDVPVYMYSTSADPESIAENRDLGATDFIVKPSSIFELSQILRSILKEPLIAICVFMMFMGFMPQQLSAQVDLPPVMELKKLSMDELLNIVVTSVSKTPENIIEVASAIQVITGNDIKRSAATRLPEALRLAPNLQVAQSGSHDWGISARGFNGAPVASSSLADKLLVMIDGRTVYTPLFGGVYWDVQNVILEDIDRIEVVSGPGGTLWGSNAVNGVVNVITKSAKESQGLYLTGSVGTFIQDQAGIRYGGQIDSSLFYRVYGQRFDYGETQLADGNDAGDDWSITQGGFRIDFMPSAKNTFTLQGEGYGGKEDETFPTKINGQHLLSRWTHSFTATSALSVQAYFDRTKREISNNPFTDELTTADFDIQHQFSIKVHQILYGVG